MGAMPNDDEEQTLDKVIKVRVSDSDHAAWTAAAKADNRTLADWIRMRCNGLPTTSPIPETQRERRNRHSLERREKRKQGKKR